jgi:O-antigen biosynthesis protein
VPPDPSRVMVTVAVATMNRPQGLERCVRAVLDGASRPTELVIIDQSTDDRTARLVAASSWDAVATVRYARQTRHGLAASRNAAILHATQPVVAFTDDDCVPDKGWLAGIVAGFHGAEQPDAVTGRVLPLGADRVGAYAVSTRASSVRAVYRGRSLPWQIGSGGNAAVTLEWLRRVGGFDERLGAGSRGRSGEDLDLFYRLVRTGATVRYEPAAIVFHERQSAERQLASRPAYGFGMGAFCGFVARKHDAYALWMFGRWAFDRGNAIGRACLRGRGRRIGEELLMIAGAIRGVIYGLTMPVNTPALAVGGDPDGADR